MVEVFFFRVWNIPDCRYESPPFKATREFIKKNNGRAIAGTKEQIQPCQLDESGRYFAKQLAGQALRV